MAARDRALGRRWRSPTTLIGLGGLSALIAVAVVAPILWGSEAADLTGDVGSGSSRDHWLGTDQLGRDSLLRTLVATRLTLTMAAGATAIAAVAGTAIGAGISLLGLRGRAVGGRFIDFLISFPPIILALTVVAIFGPSVTSAAVAIGLAFTPAFARLTSTLAASVAGKDYVAVAGLLGLSRTSVLRGHVLPNIAEPLLVLSSVGFGAAVVSLSGLSFLGLGVQPPSYDWGQMLAGGLQALYTNPVQAVGPSIGIAFSGLTAGFIGDGLAIAANPVASLPAGKGSDRGGRVVGRGRTGVRGRGTPDAGVGADLALDLRGLSITVPGGEGPVPIVSEVSFGIHPGEIVGLVGESGSGKTVTAMAIAQLLPSGLEARAATLRLGELDLLADPDDKRLATEIGVVFQDPAAAFNPALRLGGQITEVARVHRGMSRRAAQREAIDRLREVSISEPERRLNQYPHELSGGIRQRAMIAMALMSEPALLIADEPTTALDVTVQAGIIRLLREINRRRRTSMLFISHDVAVVAQLCDRVLVMYGGTVVEDLTVDSLRSGNAGHPYTGALLAATPTLDKARRGQRLASLPGRPPRPGERPTGCPFSARCTLVVDKCHDQRPELDALGERHAVACHRAGATTPAVRS